MIVHYEATSADKEVIQKIQLIHRGSYTKQQTQNVDGITVVYQKKIPSRTIIAREEKSMPVVKALDNRQTFLSGANVADDFKLN